MNIQVSNPVASDRLQLPLLRIVIVGHVDHGKSTLIGRLLHETGSLPDGKLENLKAVSARRGMPFEWSFLLDALQTERDQGITIDTSQIHFRTPSRDIVLIDAPGHTEFLRNMITGASQADAALLLVDATEGIREQTRRHGYLLHLLGVRQVAVLVNKMDRVEFDADRFNTIKREITVYLANLNITAAGVIPISARNGDNVTRHSPSMSWHDGPTVVEVLEGFSPAQPPQNLPFRLPVQAVYKFDDRRIIAGSVETGQLTIGDEIIVGPGTKRATVKSIEAWPVPNESQPLKKVHAGQSVGITLDREIFIERGNIVSRASTPASETTHLRARIFWLHAKPLIVGSRLTARIGTAESSAVIVAIHEAVDPGRLDPQATAAMNQNNVGDIELALSQPLAADLYDANPRTGRIVLDFDGRIAGGGLILTVGEEAARQSAGVEKAHAGSDLQVMSALAARLAPRFENLSAADRLIALRREIAGKIVFTTSFGIEDQVIARLIKDADLDIDIATLDTGRLFPETYELWALTEAHLGRRIRAFYPRHDGLEELVAQQGINGFYGSVDARVACCNVRKVEPLNRALQNAKAWITGLRADQSQNRHSMNVISADADKNLIKLSPLFDWSHDDVVRFAQQNSVPINALHASGFVSIGCAPCTRAIKPGEPERAGRWWWEDEAKKECGLHSRQ